MELAHSLLLNETALVKLSNDKKPVFVYEWLRFLDKVLPVANEVDIKEKQEHILKILLNQLEKSPGPPTRKLLAKNLATLFTVGHSYSLNVAINMCNDIVRNKDDSPSFLPTKLAAITALGEIYNRLGRLVGRSYEETISVLLKSMKQVESQSRCQIMLTLQHIVRGLGSVAANSHRDILKVTKVGLVDRSMVVRSSACKCLLALIENSLTFQLVDVDNTVSMCFKTLEDSNYDVRCEMAKVLGFLLSRTQLAASNISTIKNAKPISLDDIFNMLTVGFSKSASGLFNKPTINDVNRGSTVINREVRVGVTHAIVEFAKCMGRDWLERNLSIFISKVLNLVSGNLKLGNNNYVTTMNVNTNNSNLSDANVSNLTGSNASNISNLNSNNTNNNCNHVEAVYARRCVNFILRNIVNLQLCGSGGQLMMGRELCAIIRYTISCISGTGNSNNEENIILANAMTNTSSGNIVNRFFSNSNSSNSIAQMALQNQHILISALQELSCLIQTLNTAATVLLDQPTSLIDCVIPALLLPSSGTQLAAAFCLRSLAEAVPAQLMGLMDKCLEKLTAYQSHPDAVIGLSFALAGLVSTISLSTAQSDPTALASKVQEILNKGEEMLRSCNSQSTTSTAPTATAQYTQTNNTNSRLISAKTQSAWYLISAGFCLGSNFIKPQLPKLFLLWRSAFPKTISDVEVDKQRGDSMTWQISLESKSGALCSIQCFIEKCGPDLLSEDILKRLLPLIESTLSIMTVLPSVCRNHGNHLKGPAAMLRMRLYNLLLILPHQAYHSTYNTLLRELVAEFTLTDNPANTTTSHLRSLCHVDDSVILGSWLQETDQKEIEDQLQPNSANGSGALEHDSIALILCDTSNCKLKGIVSYPAPLPLGVAVIDSSVQLFGVLFPRIQTKHRQQILEHFSECIRQAAKSIRQQATQINIFTAVLCAMKRLAETKSTFGNEYNLKKEASNLIFSSLLSPNPILRCAAGECLGRMAQVIGEASFVTEMAQHSFQRLKTDRDLISRTGYSLALGCLHRYVGSLSSAQHLSRSVGILLALAQDYNSPAVQVWSLHALALIADSGGPMFRRDYLELTLNLVLSLLLQTPQANVDVYQCLGKVLGALITTLGPELQIQTSETVANLRTSCIVSCSILQSHSDSMVQAEAVSCLQQLHMFAPKHINLSSLMSHLYQGLSSCHLLLRRAAVSCLRQLSQKESPSQLLSALSTTLNLPNSIDSPSQRSKEFTPPSSSSSPTSTGSSGTNSDILNAAFKSHGLIGALFQMLDWEQQDVKLSSDLEDTILCLLQSPGRVQYLSRWMRLMREVIQAGKSETNNPSTVTSNTVSTGLDNDDDLYEDDDIKFSANKDEGVKAFKGCRWPTKVFAAECFRKILHMYKTDTSAEYRERHFNLNVARRICMKVVDNNNDIEDNNESNDCLILHLSDLVSFSFISATADVDRLRLEGLAALQDIISMFGAVRDPDFPDQAILEQYQAQVGAALRPAFARGSSPDVTAAACEVCSRWIGSGVLTDSRDLKRVQQLLLTCLDKLRNTNGGSNKTILSSIEGLAVLRAWAEIYLLDCKGELVNSVLNEVSGYWWSILHSYANLCLPNELTEAVMKLANSDNDTSNKSLFSCDNTGDKDQLDRYRQHWATILYAAAYHCSNSMNSSNNNKIYLILGLSMDAFCGLVSKQPNETIKYCLCACNTILSISNIFNNTESNIILELLNVTHRLILTRDSADIHQLVLQFFTHIIEQYSKVSVSADNNNDVALSSAGGGGGIIKSVEFGCCEVIICGLTRYIPQLLDNTDTIEHKSTLLPLVCTNEPHSAQIIVTKLITTMTSVTHLILSSSNSGAVSSLLPSLLHLCDRILQLEVYQPGKTRTGLPRARCSNDTSPWTDNLQEQFGDSIMEFYQFLLSKASSDENLKNLMSQSIRSILDKKLSNKCVVPLYIIVCLMKTPCHWLIDYIGDNRQIQLQMVEYIQCLWQNIIVLPNQSHQLSNDKDNYIDVSTLALIKTIYNLISIDNEALVRFFARNLSELIINWLFKLPNHLQTNEIQPVLVRQFSMSIDYIELLIGVVESDKKSVILNTLVPLLIVLLIPPEEQTTSKQDARYILHNHAIQRINSLAQNHVDEFRYCMQQSSMMEMKLKLANVIAKSNTATMNTITTRDSREYPTNQMDSVNYKINTTTTVTNTNKSKSINTSSNGPKIALKMDFSNFTSTDN